MVLSGAVSRSGGHLSNGGPISSEQELPKGSRIARPGTKSNFGYSGNTGYHRQAAGDREAPSLSAKTGLSTTYRHHAQRSSSPELIQSTGRRAGPSPRERSQSHAAIEHAPSMLTRRSSSAKQLSVVASSKEPSSEMKPQGSDAPAHKRTISAVPRKTGVFGGLSNRPGALSGATTAQQRAAEVQYSGSRGQPDPENSKVARSAIAARRGSPSPRQMAFSRGPGEAPSAHSGLPSRRRSPSPTERSDPSPRRSGIASRTRSPSPSPTREGFVRKTSGGPSGRSPNNEGESDGPAATTHSLARRASPSPRGQGTRGRSGGEAVPGGLAARRGSPSPRAQVASLEGMDASSVEHGRRSPSPARELHSRMDRKAPTSRLGGGHVSTGSGRKLPSPRAAGPAVATRGGASARALPSPRRQANDQTRMSTRSVLPASGTERPSSRSSFLPSPSTESRLERGSASASASRSLLSAVAPGRNALLGSGARSRRGASSIAVPSSHLEQPSSRRLSPPRDYDASDSGLRAAAGRAPSSHDMKSSGTRGINAASGRLLSTNPRNQAASKEATSGQGSSKSWESSQSRVVESAASRQVRSLTPSKLGRANASGKLTHGRESPTAQTTDKGTVGTLLEQNAAFAQRQTPVVCDKQTLLSPKDRNSARPASKRPATTSPRKVEEMAFPKSTAGSQAGSLRRTSSPTPRRQSMSPRPRKESPRPQIAFPAVRHSASALPGKHTGLLMRKDHGSSTAASTASRIQRDAGTRKQATPREGFMFARKASGTKGEQAGSDDVAETSVQNGREVADTGEDGGLLEESGSAELLRDAACSAGFQRNNPFRKEMRKDGGRLTFPRQTMPAPGQLQPSSAKFGKSSGASTVQSVSESRLRKESSLKKLAASPQQSERGPIASGTLVESFRAARNISPSREPSAAPENCTTKVTPASRNSPRTRQASTVQSEASGPKMSPARTKVTITPRKVGQTTSEDVVTRSKRLPSVHSAKTLASARQGSQSPSTKQLQSASALQRGTFILREKVSNLLKEMGSSLPGRRTMSAPAVQSEAGFRKGSRSKQGLPFRKRATSDGNLAGLELSPDIGKDPCDDKHDASHVPENGQMPTAGVATPRGGKKLWQHGMPLGKKAGPSGRYSEESAAMELASPKTVDSAAACAPVVSNSHGKQSAAPATVRQTDVETQSLPAKHSAEIVQESVVLTKGQGKPTGSSAEHSEVATSLAKPSSLLSAPRAGRQAASDAGEQPDADQPHATPPSSALGVHLSPKANFYHRIPLPGGEDVALPNRAQSPSPTTKRQESPLGMPSGLRGQPGRPASPSGLSVGHADSFSGFMPSPSPEREEASAPAKRLLPSAPNATASQEADAHNRQPSKFTSTEGRLAAPTGSVGAKPSSPRGNRPWRQTSSLVDGQPHSLPSVQAEQPASPQFGGVQRLTPPASGTGLRPASRSSGLGQQQPTSPSSLLRRPSDSPSFIAGQRPACRSSGIGRLPGAPSSDPEDRPESPAFGIGRRSSSPSFGMAERPASPKFGASRQAGTARAAPSLFPSTERPASPVFGIGRQAGASPSGIGRRVMPASPLLGGQPASLPADIERQLPALVSGEGQPEPPLFAIEERPASPLFGSRRQPTSQSSAGGERPASPCVGAERPSEAASSRLGGLSGSPKFYPASAGEVVSTVPGQRAEATPGLRPASAAAAVVATGQPSQLAFEKSRCGRRLEPPRWGNSSPISQGLRADTGAESQGTDVHDLIRNISDSRSRNSEARSTASVSSSLVPVGSNEHLQHVVAPKSPADPQVEGCEECLASTDPKEDVESVQLFNAPLPSLRQQAEGRFAAFDYMRRSTEVLQQSQYPDVPCSLGLPPSPSETTSFEDAVEDEEESRGASCGSLEGRDPPMTGSLMSTVDSQVTASQEVHSDLDVWDPLDSSPDPIVVEELSEGDEKNATENEGEGDEKTAQAGFKDKSQMKKEMSVQEDMPGTFSDEDALSSLSLSSLVKDDCPSPPRVSIGDFEAGNPFYGVTDLSSDDDTVTVSTVQGRSVVPVPREAWREDLFSPRRNPLFEQWAMLSAKGGAEQQVDSQDSDLPTRVDALTLRSSSTQVHKERVVGESGVWLAGGTMCSTSASQLPRPFEGRNLDKVQRGSNFFSLLDDSCDRGAQAADGSPVVAGQKQQGGLGEVSRSDIARAQGQASPPGARREQESSFPADSVWPQSPRPRVSVDSDVAEMSISGQPRASSRVSEASDTASVESSSTFVFKPPVVDSKLESEFPTWQDTTASSECGASCEPPDCNDPDLWSRPPRCPGASETSISTKELLEESELESLPQGPAEAGTSCADVDKSMDSSDIHSSVFEYTFDSLDDGGASSASKSVYGQFQQKYAQSRIQNLFYGCSTVEGQPHMPRRGIPPPTNFGKEPKVDEPKVRWAAVEVNPKTVDTVEATGLIDARAPPALSLTRNASSGSMSEEGDDDDEGILPPTPDAESNGKRVFGKSESDSCESRAALGFHYSSPPVNIESIDEDTVLKSAYDSPQDVGSQKECPAPSRISGNGDGRVASSSCTDASELRGVDRMDSTADVECHSDVYYGGKGGLLGDDDDGEDLEDVAISDSPRSKDVKAPTHGLKLLKRQGPPGVRRSTSAAMDKPGSSSSKNLSVQNWLSISGPKSQCSDSLLSSNGSSQGPGARESEFGPEPQSSDAYHSRAESFDSSTQVSQSESGLSLQFTPKDEPVEAAFPQEGPSGRLRSASHRREDSGSRALLRGAGSSGSNVVCGLSSAPLADVLEDSPFEESATHSSAVSFTDYRDVRGNRVSGRQRKSYSVSSEIEVDDGPPSSRHAARRLERSASVEASHVRKSSSGSLVDKLRRKISLSHSRRSSMGSTPRKEPREGVREFGCFAFLSPRTPRRGAKG